MNAQIELPLLKENVAKSKMIQVTWAAAQPEGYRKTKSFLFLHFSTFHTIRMRKYHYAFRTTIPAQLKISQGNCMLLKILASLYLKETQLRVQVWADHLKLQDLPFASKTYLYKQTVVGQFLHLPANIRLDACTGISNILPGMNLAHCVPAHILKEWKSVN